MSDRPRAVVTGAAGFIGRNLVAHLTGAGWDVLAVDQRPSDDGAVRSVVADVTTPGALLPVLDADTTVFHLAASADIRRSVEEPRANFQSNVVGLFEVLEAARRSGCRVIFPSTASVFDEDNAPPWKEDDPKRPRSPYAAGKLAGEAYCCAYHRCYGLDVRVARLFNTYGPGIRQFVIHDLVRKVQRDRRTLEIVGDSEQVRDFLYVDDAVAGLALVALRGAPGEDYNVGSGIPVRLRDLARQIAGLMGCPDIALATTGRSYSGDTSRSWADISKIGALGFAPRVPLEEGLGRTIAWLGEHRPSAAASP
jgi:nucleoside-diphosphate-sugar epimerase